jgi:hypothetical protein
MLELPDVVVYLARVEGPERTDRPSFDRSAPGTEQGAQKGRDARREGASAEA